MDHKKLDVWKKGIELVSKIYKATEKFPKPEIYGLTNQVRRAAVSIPSNTTEGAARNSDKKVKNSFSSFILHWAHCQKLKLKLSLHRNCDT